MESGADDPHWREETRFVHTLAQRPRLADQGHHRHLPARKRSQGFEAYVESVLSPNLVGLQEDPAHRTG